MTDRRIHVRLDDGSQIEVTWAEGTKKLVLTVEEIPAPASEVAPPVEEPKKE